MKVLKKFTIDAPRRRKVVSGDTQVTVVEEEGELTAIVVDSIRGVIHVPLGVVDPLWRVACKPPC